MGGFLKKVNFFGFVEQVLTGWMPSLSPNRQY